MELPRPVKTENGWIAHITVIDVFGNLTTDLPASALEGRTDILFRLRGAEVDGITESYGHKQPGDLIALVDSEDYLEIAVVNGSAAQKLGAKCGGYRGSGLSMICYIMCPTNSAPRKT